MTQATEIKTLRSTTKYEALNAMDKINYDGYTVDVTRKVVIDADGGEYPIHFFRNADEVIAISDLHYGESGAMVEGSKGNWYNVEYETVTLDD